MNRVLSILSLVAVMVGAAACDFPNDPPLRPPVNSRGNFLLNLDAGYRYAYLVGFDYSTEAFLKNDTIRPMTAPNGEYFRMSYEHLDISGGEPFRVILLLPFVRNTSSGLEYYISNPPNFLDSLTQHYNPTLFWKFPYPAEKGTVWNNPDRPWRVELVATDTLVYSTDGVQGYKCYMYEVSSTSSAEPFLYYRVFFVPGEAVFKIQHIPDQITAITYFWSWDS